MSMRAPPDRPGARLAPFGAYRRAVRIEAGPGEVSSQMEDDVHHFGVVLRHDGEIVSGVQGIAWRAPWVFVRVPWRC